MAKNNEAKITFTASTSEFTSGIKEMNSTLNSLGKQLTLNNTQLKGNGESVELLQNKQKILQERLQASNEKVEMTRQCLEQAKQVFGENSEETQKWTDKLVVAETQNQRIQNELDRTTSSLNDLEKSTAESETALGQLQSTIEQQESELVSLADEYTNVVLEQGEGSEEAQNLASEIESLSSSLEENRSKLENAQNATRELTGSFQDTEEETEEFGDTLEAILTSEVITGAIDKIKDGLKSLIDTYKELDSGYDNLEMATGAQGQALQGLKDDYDNVAGSIQATGFSQEDLGSIIGEINTQYGYTGDKLVDLSKKMLEYCRITGSDGVDSTQTLRKCMDSFNLSEEDSINLLDMWASVGQSTGQDVNQLTDAYFQHRAELDDMNISYETAIPLFAKIQQSGGNVNTVIKGLSTAYKNWAKDGKDANAELKNTFNKIKNAKSDTEASAIAMDTFGNKAGAELSSQIRTGKLAYKDLMDTMSQDYSGTVDNTFNAVADGMDYLEQAGNNVKLIFGDIGGTILSALTPALKSLATGLQNIHQWFASLPQGMQTVIGVVAGLAVGLVALATVFTVVVAGIGMLSTAWGAIVGLFTTGLGVFASIGSTIGGVVGTIATLNPIVLVAVAAIATLIAIGVTLYKNWDTVKAKAIQIWNAIKSTIVNVATAICNGVKSKFNALKSGIATIFNAIKSTLSNIWNTIKSTVVNVVMAIVNGVKAKFNALKSEISSIFNAIKSTASNIWNNIKSTVINIVAGMKNGIHNGINAIKSVVSNVFGALFNIMTAPFRNAWNTISNIVENIKNAIGGIKNAASGIGSFVSKVIPHATGGIITHASGGIATVPTSLGFDRNGNQHIFGEAGAEALLPLDGFYNYLDNRLSSLQSQSIDYDRLGKIIIKSLAKSNQGIYMSGELVGVYSASSVQKENIKTENRANRLGGKLDHV